MRLRYAVGLFLVVAAAGRASDSPRVAAEPGPLSARSITCEGQVFELANSACTGAVHTEEYTLAGETVGSWTQLITVQRIPITVPADRFVSQFRTRVEAQGAMLEVLHEHPNASVFAVRFPPSGAADEQVMICLALRDNSQPRTLRVVQYAVKPARCPLDVTTVQVRAWRDRLVAHARACSN